MPTLLLSSRYTEDSQLLWRAAGQAGWAVERIRGLRLPPDLSGEVVLHVEALLAPSIAERLNIQLLEPAEQWLTELPSSLKKRRIDAMPLREARRLTVPAFIKPPNDKTFPAKVYERGEFLPELDGDPLVLVAEPVQWNSEFRCFCLDGRVLTASPYLRRGRLAREENFAATEDELAQARDFAERVLAASDLPRAVVVDVGTLVGNGWATVEANASWASGIYGCDPVRALEVIRASCINPSGRGFK